MSTANDFYSVRTAPHPRTVAHPFAILVFLTLVGFACFGAAIAAMGAW